MTKWKKEITKKLMARLKPMYAKIRRPGHMAEVIIPASDSCYEQCLYFAYQSDVVYDDMYGGSHVLKHNDYVSCYYVEGDDEGDATYVEVATNLKQAVGYLLQSCSINQLLSVRLGSIDDVGSYVYG